MGLARGYAENVEAAASEDVAEVAADIVDHSDALVSLTEKQWEIPKMLAREQVLAPTDVGAVVESAFDTVRAAHPDADVSLDVQTATLAKTSDGLAITIADRGPAIPEMDRRVLEGEHDVEPLYHGSGLGLWLVSWIARRSNGVLSFDENDHGGTTVTVRFQRASGEE
jgi:sensor histidine kinase regulating citrate/malate metabolism